MGGPVSYGGVLARGEPVVARVGAWAALCRHASGACILPPLGWVVACILVLRPTTAHDPEPLAHTVRGAQVVIINRPGGLPAPSRAAFGLAHRLWAATPLRWTVRDERAP